MKFKLYDGSFAIIDECNFERFNKYTWRRDKGGYVCRATQVNGKPRHIFMHRELLGLKAGDKRQCDHINRIRHDNRIKNLRIASSLINGWNRQINITSNSGYVGVSWNNQSNKWQAQIKFKQKNYYLGLYKNKQEAASKYIEARGLFMKLVNEMKP